MPRLRRVTMQNFRGAAASSSIEFGNKPLILIFGENGTGKSTIVDAIDLVCNEAYGTVDERSSATRKDHLPTIGSTPEQVEVQIEFDAGLWTGNLNKHGKAVITGNIPRPSVQVLRRRSLLQLTEDRAGKRYERLASLIDVGNIEKAEAQLGLAIKQVGKDQSSQTQRMASEQSRIEELWQAAGQPSPDAMHWARSQASLSDKEVSSQIAALDGQITAAQAVSAAESAVQQALSAQAEAQQNLQAVTARIGTLAGELNSDLLQLWERAAHALQHPAHSPELCPVCGQPAPRLAEELQARLAASAQLLALTEQQKTLQERLLVAQSQRETAERQRAKLPPLPYTAAELRSAQAQWAELQQRRHNLTALRLALQAHDEASAEAYEHTRVLERLTSLLKTTRQTREQYIQRIFDAVAEETQRLYAYIHPNEPLGLSRLELEANNSASLEQIGHFYGHDNVAPQGVYSEAHLDTLGFCFWLAVVKHTAPNAIVVLDDVFTSVDAKHLGRIDELLLGEAQAQNIAQIVAITHYRGWIDKLKAGHAENQLEIKELGRWTLQHGISVRGVLPDRHELQNKLAEPFLDRQAVASKAGVLLENMLDHITVSFRLKLPRQAVYTLDPLLSAVTGESKKWHTVTAGQPPQPWLPVLARLNALAFIRNQVGAHFNPVGSDITDDDIREFAEATLALAGLVYCPHCGRRVYSKDETTHLSCGGECKQAKLYRNGVPSGTP